MTQIQPAVREKMNDPSDGQVRLLVGVSDDSESVISQMEAETGATVERQLPYGLIDLTIPERDLQNLCDLDVVETVEIESKGTHRIQHESPVAVLD